MTLKGENALICLSICTHAWTNMTSIMSTSLSMVQAHVSVYYLYIFNIVLNIFSKISLEVEKKPRGI